MLVIVGALVVLFAVAGGYTAHGGHLAVLWQPEELVIIGGAALGSLMISAPVPILKMVIAQVLGTLKDHAPKKEEYIQVLLCLYEVFKLAKSNPLSLEPHVEKPEASDIFKKYPAVLHNHHALDFFCDTLKVQISAPMSPYDLEDMMNADIDACHKAEGKAPVIINRVGDAMPGLGIVAAVLGVVITMGKLASGKEVIGNSVAAALVGTFLGILISYGFMQPLAAKMDLDIEDGGRFMELIKAGVLAYAKDCSPKVCVEFARRTIPPASRPTFEEVDKATSGAGKAA